MMYPDEMAAAKQAYELGARLKAYSPSESEGVDKEPSALATELAQIDQDIVELQHSIKRLTDQLRPVLTPAPERNQTTQGVGDMPVLSSPYLDRLVAAKRGLRTCLTHIDDLRGRLLV